MTMIGDLQQEPLAFASHNNEEDNNYDRQLVVASSRCPFHAEDGTLLNVECFGPPLNCGDSNKIGSTDNDDDGDSDSDGNSDEWPLLLYVHGICESAETWGVQTLAQNCAKHRWRLLVLELAGHGLSADSVTAGGKEGRRRRRATCPNFDELVRHVAEFTIQMAKMFPKAKGLALAGGSLGGALIAYAVHGILSSYDNIQQETKQKQQYPKFYGIAMISPALGINDDAVPPTPVVTALQALSYLLPSHGILTPIEDPEHYACPPTSTRNYSGRWPLSTSAMLLDVTSNRIPNDVKCNQVVLKNQLEGLPSLLVIMGDQDEIVPLSSVQQWFDAVSNLSSETGQKRMVVLNGAGHGFFHEGQEGRISRRRKQQNNDFLNGLFEWLNSHS